MRHHTRISVLAAFLALVGCATPRADVVDAGGACLEFDADVHAFARTLLTSDDAPPRSDPQRSPPIAREMRGHAHRCLQSRGVAVDVVGDRLIIRPGEVAVPATTARSVAALTGGAVVYDVGFFLAKPYAAAAFDKETNVLFLPHAAIQGRDSEALQHELRHVRSLALLRPHARSRHLSLQHADTKPDALAVDEVFAYAAGARDGSDDDARRWSQEMAEQYLGFVRAALGRDDTVVRLDGTQTWCPLEPATRRAIEATASCLASQLGTATIADIDACDAAPLPAPCAGD